MDGIRPLAAMPALQCRLSVARRAPAAGHEGRRATRCSVAAAGAPLDLVAFTFIADDLVYPDGTTHMAQVGGGGPQTLFGYQLYQTQPAAVGLAAGVGADLPVPCRDWLGRCGVALDGLLLQPDCPTPRAWQVLEDDGRRAEIWRTLLAPQVLAGMLRPPLSALPPAYQAAKAYHVAVNPIDPLLGHLQELGEAAGPTGLLSVETFTTAGRPLSGPELQQLASLCDIFSPNEAEALSILGLAGGEERLGPQQPGGARGGSSGSSGGAAAAATDAATAAAAAATAAPAASLLHLTRPFLQAGARVVAVRRGPLGALVHSAQEGAWEVPAMPGTRVVDTTGCGNAFCGALLAALQAGEGLAAAGAWGCAAGSLMAEYRGVPQLPPAQLHAEARRRAEALLPLARKLG